MERQKVEMILGARILFEGWDPTRRYNLILEYGKIKEVAPYHPDCLGAGGDVLDATNSLIGPSLCHAHIHLDKCFLLSDPKYKDLQIIKGDFNEAHDLTSKAKARFENDDLIRRGKWLIAESIAAGVTHMRAFAEVDHIVQFKCLDAAIELKKLFADACKIQICAFAQEPIYSGEHGEENRILMERAIQNESVEVVGSTPYVENNPEAMRKNMQWAIAKAIENDRHLDLHLDYSLDLSQKSQTTHFLDLLKESRAWKSETRVALGHCTRLTLLDREEWKSISKAVGGTEKLDLHFVGLPTSDMYMRGKANEEEGGGQRPRGTLQIPQMIYEYRLKGAISVNNVGNAFTPQGSCDPLSIASMGVGIYHAGTKADARLLYECVSTRAKAAIGYPSRPFQVGEEANFVMFESGGDGGPLSRQRGRRTLQEVVYDPPKERKTIYRGHLITI